MEIAAQLFLVFLSVSVLLLWGFRTTLKENQTKTILVFLVGPTVVTIIFLLIAGNLYQSLSFPARIILFLLIPASYIYTLVRLFKQKDKADNIWQAKFWMGTSLPQLKIYRKQKKDASITNHKTAARQTTSLHLSPERTQEMAALVKEHFCKTKPYLQHGYTLRKLSEEIHIPLHHLSAFINQYYKMNFNDFINEYRILSCIEKLLKKEWEQKKLEGIAEESGFNNRNTFTSAFKKATGMNPSEFLKYIKSGKIQKEKAADHDCPNEEEMSKVCKLMSKLAG